MLLPFGLARFGRVLSTRDLGRKVGQELLASAADADGVVLGFWDVQVATPSMLDELVDAMRAWLAGAGAGSRLLVAAGYNEDVRETLEMVLERRKMALAALEGDQIKLLGGSRHLAETMNAAQELGAFSAPDLAERLKVKLPNLHQRLQALMEAGALTREEDESATRGRKHQYSAPRTKDLEALTPAS